MFTMMMMMMTTVYVFVSVLSQFYFICELWGHY